MSVAGKAGTNGSGCVCKPKTFNELKSEYGLGCKRQDNRGGSTKRGYDHRWRKARIAFLRKNPLCVQCKVEGRTEQATVVDHIKPHKGDKNLFWNKSNWQSLCKKCHDTKTAKCDGAFGKREKGVGGYKSLQPDEM